MLWSEKHRPKTPLAPPHNNILLHGPPGTGKTTYAARLSPEIELNASVERGIATIRSLKNHTAARKYIFLDECDYLTPDAQNCLRRVMEEGKFVLCANYLSKISLPIRSRCKVIKFSNEQMFDHLKEVVQLEKVKIDDIERVWMESGQDIRRCLNILQTYHAITENLTKSKSLSENTTIQTEEEISLSDEYLGTDQGNSTSLSLNNTEILDYLMSKIPNSTISEFLSLDKSKMDSFVDDFINKALLPTKFVNSLIDHLINSEAEINSSFYELISETEEMIVHGVDTEILMYFLTSNWLRLTEKYKM